MDEATARKLYPEAKELAGLISEEWTTSYDHTEGRAELCMRDTTTGEVIPIAQLLPDLTYDDRRFMTRAPELFHAVFFLLQMAFRKLDEQNPPKESKPKDYAAECAMKCQNDGLFKRYLMDVHGLQDAGDAERIKTRVRSLLAITSMRELNDDPAAQARWKTLRGDFDAWRRSR